MKRTRRLVRSAVHLWKAPPRPWHLLFAPAIPLLAFLESSVAMVPPSVVFVPTAFAVTVSLMLASALAPVGVDRHKTAFAVSLLMLAGLSFMTVMVGAAAVRLGAAAALLYVIVAVAVLVLLRAPGAAKNLTIFANRAFAIAVVLVAFPIVRAEWQRPRSSVQAFELPAAAATRPDVYVIVLDGYAREDVLRDVYGFENALLSDMRAQAFSVADDAVANYSHTALSMASALNGEYIPDLRPAVRHETDRRGLGDLIAHSRFFRAFAAAGYRIRAYASEYGLMHPYPADERPSPPIYLNEFSYAAYETTLLPTLFSLAGVPRAILPMALHRHHIKWTLNHLSSTPPADTRPTLVFVHILAPHPPFAFDADGTARRTRMPALLSDGDMWRRIASSRGESYKAGYADTVRVVNEHLRAALRAIVTRGRESIVLVHSDHGPGSGLHWDQPERSDIRERMGILLAARFPAGAAASLPAGATPINAYRLVLNQALGMHLPALEDRAYFSTWSRPFAFIDMTERLRPVAVATR